MIKKFKIFEKISWWKNGDFEDDDDIEENEIDIKFKIGDKVSIDGDIYFWQDYTYDWKLANINNAGKWDQYQDFTKLTTVINVDYCEDIKGYTGEIIQLAGRWPWYQTKNIFKI